VNKVLAAAAAASAHVADAMAAVDDDESAPRTAHSARAPRALELDDDGTPVALTRVRQLAGTYTVARKTGVRMLVACVGACLT
jgi:hypothetical protein